MIYRIQFLSENYIRIQVAQTETAERLQKDSQKEMIDQADLPDLDIDTTSTGSLLRFRSPLVTFELNRQSGGFSIYDRTGKQLLHCVSGPRWRAAHRTASIERETIHLGDGTQDLRCRIKPFELWKADCLAQLTLSTCPNAHYYGFGMSAAQADYKGKVVDNWILHTGSDGYRTPYFYSTCGFSLFLNTPDRSVFDMESSAAGSLDIFAEDLDHIDLFVHVGSLKTCLEGYTWLTGRSPEMPDWVFGNWMGGWWQDQENILAVAEEFRRREIPMDVLRQDSSWQLGHECDFRWDGNYPNPAELIGRLHRMGFFLHLWSAHMVNYKCRSFEEGLARDVFLKNRDGSLPLIKWWKKDRGGIIDFTNPVSRRWWQEQLKPLLAGGIAGFKTDGGNEHYLITGERRFHDGRTGKQAHNLYPNLFARCVSEVQQEVHGVHTPIWIRSGYTGIQRYPVLWAGDQHAEWETIEKQIRCGISAGLSGVSFWSSDGGGFAGNPDEALYIRGFQFAFWNPICQIFGKDREPWHYSEEACRIFRIFASVRNRLHPYIKFLASISTKTGIPIMRHMILEYPQDPVCPSIDDQYFFGPSFLVAPIYTPDGRRRIYFPEGDWIDICTLERISGPSWEEMDFPVESMPVYARAGYVVPLKPLSQHIPPKSDPVHQLYFWESSNGLKGVWKDGIRGDVICEDGTERAEPAIRSHFMNRYFMESDRLFSNQPI